MMRYPRILSEIFESVKSYAYHGDANILCYPTANQTLTLFRLALTAKSNITDTAQTLSVAHRQAERFQSTNYARQKRKTLTARYRETMRQ